MIETFNKFIFKTALVLCWRTFEQEISKTMALCHYVKSQVPTLHVKKVRYKPLATAAILFHQKTSQRQCLISFQAQLSETKGSEVQLKAILVKRKK